MRMCVCRCVLVMHRTMCVLNAYLNNHAQTKPLWLNKSSYKPQGWRLKLKQFYNTTALQNMTLSCMGRVCMSRTCACCVTDMQR